MAYSQDLRERVVRVVQRGDRTQPKVAEDFEVSLSFVEEVWRRYRQVERLRAEVARQPDVRLDELCERVPAADGTHVSPSAMSWTLKRLGFTQKRVFTPVSRPRSG